MLSLPLNKIKKVTFNFILFTTFFPCMHATFLNCGFPMKLLCSFMFIFGSHVEVDYTVSCEYVLTLNSRSIFTFFSLTIDFKKQFFSSI